MFSRIVDFCLLPPKLNHWVVWGDFLSLWLTRPMATDKAVLEMMLDWRGKRSSSKISSYLIPHLLWRTTRKCKAVVSQIRSTWTIENSLYLRHMNTIPNSNQNKPKSRKSGGSYACYKRNNLFGKTTTALKLRRIRPLLLFPFFLEIP